MPWVQGSWVCQWCINTAVGQTSTDINLAYTAVGYDRPISLLAYPTIGYASSETDLVYTAFGNIGFNAWGAG